MGVVKRIGGRCRRCYTCVRNCPVKAISVENGEADIIEELCVNCGTCVRVCHQKAKKVESHIEAIMQHFKDGAEVIALLAPSFPASFHDVGPKQVIAGLKRFGFKRVIEVAFGAELVGREARRLAKNPGMKTPLISSPCPVVVSLIEKQFPHLIPHLTPIVSPLLALGRYLDTIEEKPSIKVFIGPCVAKKGEINDPELKGVIHYALTFRELKEVFQNQGVDLGSLTGEIFDPPHPGEARVFPLVGGLLKTAGMEMDILDSDVALIEGPQETLEFLKTLKEPFPQQRFIDILFCRGCIDGVEMESPLSHLERKQKVVEFVGESRHLNPSSLPDVNLNRDFYDKQLLLTDPSEGEISEIMKMFGKYNPEDELNCGACGYPTCREKAVAVYHGFAEPEMCLPEIIKELEETCASLQISHDQLKKAQDELVQSEKLASLGQLSAGVAHELNNPLGGILLFSNLLLEKVRESRQESIPEELDVIVKEATRCRNIVRGLLDFARQSKLQKTGMNIHAILTEIAQMEKRTVSPRIGIEERFDPAFPPCLFDPVQIRQAFTNIIHNAMEAMPGGGTCTIQTQYLPDCHQGRIVIEDTGIGIPAENIPKLFTPFYTTKGIGKGTGLGLAISYGIIKMHRGGISVSSEVGKGTTFTIVLPVEIPEFDGTLGRKNGHKSVS